MYVCVYIYIYIYIYIYTHTHTQFWKVIPKKGKEVLDELAHMMKVSLLIVASPPPP